MEIKEIITKSTELSKNLDLIATGLFNTSKILYSKGEINYKQYNEIYNNYYQPIISLSSKVVMDNSIELIEDLDLYLEEIKKGSEKIERLIGRIEKAQEVFTSFAHLIAAAASVATFVASPNPASFFAASSSIHVMIKKVESLLADEKEKL